MLGGGHFGQADTFEMIERKLSYDWGKLLIKPQLDLSTRFTDNLRFGNDSLVTTIYTNLIPPHFDAATNFVPAQLQVSTVRGQIPVGTNTNFRLNPVESEFLVIASPGMKFQLGETGGNTFTFDYNYDRIFYLTFPEFDTTQHRGAFTTDLKLGRFTIKGSDSVQLLSSFLNGNNSGLSNQVDRVNWFDNYRITYDATAKTDFYVNGSHSLNDYDAGVALYDQETLRGSLGATYSWSERLRMFVETEYGQSSVNPNLATQPQGPHSVIYGGFFGVRGDFTTRIQGSLKVGYESRVFPGDFPVGQEPVAVSSPAVSADVSYAAGPKTFLKLIYDRSSDVSPQFGKQSFIYDRFRFTANQFIGSTGKWIVSANAGLNFGNFSDTPGVNQARTDTILDGGLRLTYQPRAWLATVLAYEYENYSTEFKDPQVSAQTRIADYQVNSITLSIIIGY